MKCIPKGSVGSTGSVCAPDPELVPEHRRYFLWSWRQKILFPLPVSGLWLLFFLMHRQMVDYIRMHARKQECIHLSCGRSPCPTEMRHSSSVRWWEQGRMLWGKPGHSHIPVFYPETNSPVFTSGQLCLCVRGTAGGLSSRQTWNISLIQYDTCIKEEVSRRNFWKLQHWPEAHCLASSYTLCIS